MASPVNLWVLLGAGIAGLILATRSLRKKAPQHYGAFIQYLKLPSPDDPFLPLAGLTFAVQDIFDIEGLDTGFGCPDWEKSHGPAQSTALAVQTLVQSGATCIAKTHMDEMAISTSGVNKHYGTPVNPTASGCVPGGSSSGSAVAIAAKLVDFSLGTDAVGGIRVPAAYCSVFGFRASHGAVSYAGVIPVSQSLDTIGWFANDPKILWRVGNVLLPQPHFEVMQPRQIIIAEDCFNLMANPEERDRCMSIIENAFGKELGDQSVTRIKLSEYFASKLPSLKLSLVCFRIDGQDGKAKRGNAALKSLKDAFQLLQRHEFKVNHEKWIRSVQGSKVSKQIKEILTTEPDLVSDAMKLKNESRAAINELLTNDKILVIPTVPGSPPRLHGKGSKQSDFEERVLTLMTVASMSGSCQVSMPIGKLNGTPCSVSLIAKHGADRFLLDAVIRLFPVIENEIEGFNNSNHNHVEITHQRPDAAELAKEKGNAAFKKKDYRSAIRNYSEAIQHDSGNATYYNNRAAAYLAIRSFYQAEADCTKAIELDKMNVKAFLRRGTTRELLGCFKEADEDFNQALALEPSNKIALEGIKRLEKRIF